jgi:type IV pilus assembly protein PilC
MPVFEYEVADRVGALSRGRMEAADEGQLILRLRERGRTVLALRPVAARGGRHAADAGGIRGRLAESFRRAAAGIRLGTLVLFTGQMAAMLAGGLHLVRILTGLAAETANRHFQKVLEDVRDSITAGSSLADALGRHPHVFNRLYLAVVRAGELAGALPTVLDSLTSYLEKTEQLRRKVRGAVAYPAVILTVSLVIVFVMIVKIVPVFEGVYARANAPLPAATRALIAVSAAVRDYTLMTLLLGLAAAAALSLGAHTAAGRWLLDALKLRLPIFGPLARKAVMARVCRTLSVLLTAGIPLIEAMETVAHVARNVVIEDAIATATRRMRDGGTIAQTLRETGQFPTMVVQLAATGEESGTLPLMLGRAAVYYEQQVDASVATLSSLIEPLLIVVMGAIAGAVIFALYLPIFSLGQAVRGGLR